MNILVTGANGFVGKNLVCALNNIKNGLDKRYADLNIQNIFEYDCDTPLTKLDEFCKNADFVFNLAGVNRPDNNDDFLKGNFGFADVLLNKLKKYSNTCPVLLSSSVQASLEGRYAGSEYGKSKLEAENLFFDYEKQSGAKVLVYRFPNIFGKWCRPNYNSAVATFCHNIANDLPVTISDPSVELELLYIDDLIDEFIFALQGREHRSGKFCCVKTTYKATLGKIVDLLNQFKNQTEKMFIPSVKPDSFEKKLLSTYISYLPADKTSHPLKMNEDARGSFTELLKSLSCGQFSVNISKPGIVKGQHWHNSKWEIFIVVSGHGLISQRKLYSDDVIESEVSGDKISAVYLLPGYTHNIINLSDSEDLVTLMWANEVFDPENPDTFYENVKT